MNIYFRVKVIKVYNRLVRNRVQFDVKQLLDKERLEAEVLVHYPDHRADILLFANNIRKSINIGIILVVLISIVALILHFYR